MRFQKTNLGGAIFYCCACFKFHESKQMDAFKDTDGHATMHEYWCGRCLKKEVKKMIDPLNDATQRWKNVWERICGFKPGDAPLPKPRIRAKLEEVKPPPKPTPTLDLEV